MRLALIGSGSYIAGHVSQAAQAAGIDAVSLSHRDDLDVGLRGADAVVNFALNPDFQRAPYDENKDIDLRASRIAARHGAHFTMLSTRRVYPSDARWGAREVGPAGGDETAYGQNKAASERALCSDVGGRLAILRLSNIVGFEYELDRPRKTFMSMVLRGLQTAREISFDMSPDTGRDFLPVEVCAHAILRIVQTRTTGIFNVGSGFAVPCGDIANAVLRGYGAGTLAVTNDEIRDAFYLNTARWNSKFPPLMTQAKLIEYCEFLGRRLKDA